MEDQSSTLFKDLSETLFPFPIEIVKRSFFF